MYAYTDHPDIHQHRCGNLDKAKRFGKSDSNQGLRGVDNAAPNGRPGTNWQKIICTII